MKYKTPLRIVLKLIGLWLIVQSLSGIITVVFQFFSFRTASGPTVFSPAYGWSFLIANTGTVFRLVVGIYLLRGGALVVNWLIPGNRPYCPECAYDLTGTVSERCPECGTPFTWDAVRPGSEKD